MAEIVEIDAKLKERPMDLIGQNVRKLINLIILYAGTTG